jgi:hypothetical protein
MLINISDFGDNIWILDQRCRRVRGFSREGESDKLKGNTDIITSSQRGSDKFSAAKDIVFVKIKGQKNVYKT